MRNINLTSIGGKLRAQGLDEETIHTALLTAPERDGLPDSEVRQIARSVAKYPPGKSTTLVLTGDTLQDFAAIRGITLDALKAIGAVAVEDEIHIPMYLDGKKSGTRRRRGDNKPFRNGAKAVSVQFSRNGLMMPIPFPASDPVLVCEGEMDLVAAISAGAACAVGTPGATPGKVVFEELQRLLAGRRAILVPDPDDAGRRWMRNVGEALLNAGGLVEYIPVMSGLDLDKRLQRESDRAATLQRLLENALPYKGDSASAQSTSRPDYISADQLDALDLPPMRWIVPDFLPEGQVILAGRPKSGKSWFVLNIAIRVAEGAIVLGKFDAAPCEVLYFALEDSLARLKKRLKAILGDIPHPPNLTVTTKFQRLDKGGFEELERWIKQHPDTRLIIIDTLAKIKPPRDPKRDSYEADYEIQARLQKIALDHNLCIFCVLHQRKASADDVFDTVTGSQGQIAAADMIAILERKRGTNTAKLHVTGRDVEDTVYTLEMEDCVWRISGTLDESEKSRLEQAQEWLRAYLAQGAIESNILLADAKAAGISRDLAFEAKKLLKIKARKKGKDGGWEWVASSYTSDTSDSSYSSNASKDAPGIIQASDLSEPSELSAMFPRMTPEMVGGFI